MQKICKEDVVNELKKVYDDIDGFEPCIQSVEFHECQYCDYYETCAGYGVSWLMDKYIYVKNKESN